MKKIALQLILVMLSVTVSWGSAVGLTLPEAIDKADIIAHIRIDDDLEIIPHVTQSGNHIRTDNGFTISVTNNTTEPEKYRNRATATILDSFKGGAPGKTIQIRHTNGYTCPNVIYQTGREYIVFLHKEADSPYYVTMNYYAGQFRIEEKQVLSFYLMPGYQHPDQLRLPYEQVFRFLKQAIPQPKDEDRASSGN